MQIRGAKLNNMAIILEPPQTHNSKLYLTVEANFFPQEILMKPLSNKESNTFSFRMELDSCGKRIELKFMSYLF